MELKDKVSSLKKVPVIAFEEGLRLGKVHDVYIDKQAKRIQGISFKTGLWEKEKESYADLSQILKIGKDVIIVSGQAAARPLTGKMTENSLKKLKGFKITTHEGAYIGELADLNVNREDGRISEIILGENRMLEVDIEEIVLGPDVIMVPAGYVPRIKQLEKEKSGLLARMSGPAAVSDSFRGKYEDIKESVRSGRGTQKMFETLKGGSGKTRERVRRTSRKIQETIEQMRKKRGLEREAIKPEAGAIKEEEAEYQGTEAEFAGRTYYESEPGPAMRPEYQGPEVDYLGDAEQFAETEENNK